RSAAAITISPGLASTGRPSTTIDSVSVAVSAIRAGAFLDVHEELVSEHANGPHDRRRDRGPQDADGGLLRRPGQTGGDVVAHVEEEIEVLLSARALLDAPDHLLDPARALAAGGALATGLAREEAHDAPGGPHDTGLVVHDHDRPGAEHGAGLAHLLLAEGQVDLVGTEPGCGHPAGDERLELAAAAYPAAQHRGEDEI